MKRSIWIAISLVLLFVGRVDAGDKKMKKSDTAKGAEASQELIKSAMSAAPESISADATIVDWNFKVVRKGTNGWTCLPDRADTPGTDPWCVNDPWMSFLKAYVKKEKPKYDQIGFAYMMKGDTPVSNKDPYATEPTGPEDWVTHLGPHLMVLVPDKNLLKAISDDHLNGGPWVMWPNTPYAHIMVPLENRGHAHMPMGAIESGAATAAK